MLNIAKGNMYSFVTHTWNVIKGKCFHNCDYCYMKVFKLNGTKFDEKELKTDLGKDNFIFVGSSNDMWSKNIPDEWIVKVLNYCKQFDNKYLFQSKDPTRFLEFMDDMPSNIVLGTTIESNRGFPQMGAAPKIEVRKNAMIRLTELGYHTMVTIEPIMDFDLQELSSIIRKIMPDWVNIGADSKNHNLPEPSGEKINLLIDDLNKITDVKIKSNLKRLTNDIQSQSRLY